MCTGADRPHWQELELVKTGELVFRFVQPIHINKSNKPGAQVQTSALQTNEFTPNEHSYGASVYVKGLLTGGLEDLYAVCPKWREWRAAQLSVEELAQLNVEVRLSPQDCQFETIRHAHASLLGVTKEIRVKLIRLIERNLLLP